MLKNYRLLPACCFFIVSSFPVLAQNVGIGTPSPTEKLHVTGNIKADTVKPNALRIMPNSGAGKVLTSDAVGNALWETNAASGSVGFGVWGDCATNGSITAYNPVADATGAANDNFGVSVSISGNYAIVGAFQDDGPLGVDQGSASIYQYNGNGWVLMQKITDATGAATDYFGVSVYISGNYAIVGSSADDGPAGIDQGSVSIYQFNGSSWIFQQKITDATGAASDFFGYAVAISGNYAIIGAFGDDGSLGIDQGSVSIYQYTGGSWVLMQKITDATGAATDFFGSSVSISGNYAIVGAYQDDGVAGTDQGSASVYQYTGGSWVLMQKLLDLTAQLSDNFGVSVSISGNYVIVGASGYDFSGTDQGSASIFQYNGSSWVLMKKIVEATGATNDRLGSSVFISGNYVFIGVSRDMVGTNANQGSAYIYVRVGTGWQKLQFITDPAGSPGDLFGVSTAFDEASKRFLLGARGYSNGSGKVVFGRIN